ncbi:phosphodiester glycosidase family protein [Mangrovibacillus cuniculi]|uniref:Copper amine oxidase n=1 Tax=Mangrovibacillus cuniculi TaxID=2593652 RepID=A0A7S8CCN5_9BACI|nr:phosphodiester glycosidase family protein [Mangrovibacillus cuniculi]QPC47536.1 hypothetical protein G8O30_11535 [Mangrovibacillus cuniculi]
MKKFFSSMIAAFLLAVLVPSITTHATSYFGYLEKSVNRSYVPLRYISEELGYGVQWNSAEQSVLITSPSSSIKLYVGKDQALANNNLITIDAPPTLYNGITYVPIRVISETMSIPIQWIQESSEIHITTTNGKLILLVRDKSYATRPSLKHTTQVYTVFDKKVQAEVVAVDLLNPNLKVKTAWAKNQKGTVDSVANIAKQQNATVAINASYFDSNTSSSTYGIPYGDVIVNGAHDSKGWTDQASIYFGYDKSSKILPGSELRSFVKSNTSLVESAVQAGPRLVNNGIVNINPLGEGFSDPRILSANAERSAIGLTNDHRLLLVATTNMTLGELAILMEKIGAVNAMNLDGGGSSGLFYKGSYIANPGRLVSNAIVVTN